MKPQVRLFVFAVFLLTFSLQFSAFVIISSVKLGFFGHVATKAELKEIRDASATLVYSEDDVLLGKIFVKNRTKINFNDLPEHFVSALVATEDARYFRHGGIDYWSMFRVFFKSILMGDRSSGGGSTLTQQLAKNLYGRQPYGILTLPVNKLKEMVISGRLEDIYTKEQILEIYLNTVPFSENCYGIGEGARRFFGKHPSQLKVEESAVLVGMLKANTYYNPRINPENAVARRNTVLFQMQKYGYITATAQDSLQDLPLKLDYVNLIAHSRAPYFMHQLREEAEQILETLKKEDGSAYRIEQDGLIIKSTLNAKMQEAAQQALREHLAETQPKFEKHWGTLDPWYEHEFVYLDELHRSKPYRLLRQNKTPEDSIKLLLDSKRRMEVYTYEGDTVVEMSPADSVKYYLKMLKGGFFAMHPQGAVKSWVGGVDYQYFPFDHVRSKRQSASTFKPFVYAAALKAGEKPCDYISNERRMYPEYDNWAPGNYHDDYTGMYSMKGALKKSVNVIAVKSIFKAGIDNTIALAHELGIESELPRQPSIALGTGSVSLFEMVQAYGVFAAQGYKHKPYMVQQIATADGEVIYEYTPEEEIPQPLDSVTASVMTEMLKSVVNAGTGNRLRWKYGLKNDLAGKTGTSQNYADAWFIGYTPELVAGTWVGGSSPVVRFKSGAYGSGSALALPVFGKFFQKINAAEDLENYTAAKFQQPDEYLNEILDCPDYREETVVDRFKDLFKEKEPGALMDDERENGFLNKLFNKK